MGEASVGLDEPALTEAVVAQGPGLFRFARSLVGTDHDAEDLVQETFLRAYRARAGFRGEASLATWLRRILVNLAIDQARRVEPPATSVEQTVEEVEARWRDDAYTVDPHVVAERAEIRAELEDALVHLPFIYRTTVLAHDLEGWPLAEVAAVTGTTVAAAKQRLRRGRMLLVSALARGAERRAVLRGVPMRCWDARLLVSDYLDDAVDPEERRLLERHLATCPTCPPLYSALVGVRNELGTWRDSDRVVPPDLAARIRRRLRARAEEAANR
jgi:RNA polymerase sigma-70 factor (ECF subfamily)